MAIVPPQKLSTAENRTCGGGSSPVAASCSCRRSRSSRPHLRSGAYRAAGHATVDDSVKNTHDSGPQFDPPDPAAHLTCTSHSRGPRDLRPAVGQHGQKMRTSRECSGVLGCTRCAAAQQQAAASASCCRTRKQSTQTAADGDSPHVRHLRGRTQQKTVWQAAPRAGIRPAQAAAHGHACFGCLPAAHR